MCASKVPGQRRTQRVLAAILASLIGASQIASAQIPNPAALQEFERYVRLTERRMEAEVRPGGAFLRIEGLPAETRQQDEALLRNGEVVTERLETRDGDREIETPGALIHHWVGTIFIPDVSLDQVLAVVQDYDRHQEYYAPQVLKSKLVVRGGDDLEFICASSRRMSSPWFSTRNMTSAIPASTPFALIAAPSALGSRSWSMPESRTNALFRRAKITACYGASIPSSASSSAVAGFTCSAKRFRSRATSRWDWVHSLAHSSRASRRHRSSSRCAKRATRSHRKSSPTKSKTEANSWSIKKGKQKNSKPQRCFKKQPGCKRVSPRRLSAASCPGWRRDCRAG